MPRNWQHRPHEKLGMNHAARKGLAVPVYHKTDSQVQ